MNRKRLLFIFFGRNTFLQVLATGFEESLILNPAQRKKKGDGANVVVLIVSPPKNILKEQREEMEEDSFHFFVDNRRRASADCRRSEIRKRKTFFKFQTITQERRLCTTIESRSCVVVWCHTLHNTLHSLLRSRY